jgi:LemA protein
MDNIFYLSALGGILLSVFVVWLVAGYNRIIRLENGMENAYGQVDVLLLRRADLVPNIVESVKGYAAHESTTLQVVAEARGGLVSARGSAAKADLADNVLTAALSRLFAVVERYPELKADASFQQLSAMLIDTENRLGFARQAYNKTVLDFNNVVSTFPGNVFARRMGLQRKPVLSIDASSHTPPKISFNQS